jgi:hypothetical protein
MTEESIDQANFITGLDKETFRQRMAEQKARLLASQPPCGKVVSGAYAGSYNTEHAMSMYAGTELLDGACGKASVGHILFRSGNIYLCEQHYQEYEAANGAAEPRNK